MPDAFRPLHGRLDFDRAVSALEPNDLLPTRPEDKVRGELGARFTRDLDQRMATASYAPKPAYFVSTPKPAGATRPAALVAIDDRVMFAALVARLKTRIESHLLGSEIVLWPRGLRTDYRWDDFESAPLVAGAAYVLRADITAFYESIEHERLARQIVVATGRDKEANALRRFLSHLTQSPRGLPQGLTSSDPLATLYLADLDFAMTGEGFRYYRHGDDIRVATNSYADCRRAQEHLERNVRRLGLYLNGAKTKIMLAATYESERAEIAGALEKEKSAVATRQLQDMDEEDFLKTIQLLELPELRHLVRGAFYHGSERAFEALIEELLPAVEGAEAAGAELLFRSTVARQPDQPDGLKEPDFHRYLSLCLTRLARYSSTSALESVGALLVKFPQRAEPLCRYLLACASLSAEEVARQAQMPVLSEEYMTEWELAQVVAVLRKVPVHVCDEAMRRLNALVDAPYQGRWLALVGIVRLLAARQDLDQDTFGRIRSLCPPVLMTDLIVAASAMKEEPWMRAFLGAAKSDRLHAVVADHEWAD